MTPIHVQIEFGFLFGLKSTKVAFKIHLCCLSKRNFARFFRLDSFFKSIVQSRVGFTNFRNTFIKGGFYSEGTDVFVISPNRWTKLFSWTWILTFCHFKWFKFCHIRLHFAFWAFRRGISGSFFFSLSFSCTQIVIKKSKNENSFLVEKRSLSEIIIIWVKNLSFWTKQVVIWWLKVIKLELFFCWKKKFEWNHHHLNEKLIILNEKCRHLMTFQWRFESERKKEPQIPGKFLMKYDLSPLK